MGRLVSSMDWSKSPLGPIADWPQSLRTATSLCLASTFPISMTWGSKHVQIYNDGYWPICGAKHPHSMGMDFRECWASAWPVIGEAFESALTGQSVFLENQRIFIDRYGYLEETFFTFSFSPIRDETGGVGGLFHPVTEVTAKLLSERRTGLLRDLAARIGRAKSVDDVLVLAAKVVADNPFDVPFALFYLLDADGGSVRLATSAGIAEDAPLRLARVDTDDAAVAWPIAAAFGQGTTQVGICHQEGFGPAHCGPYPESPKQALVVPLAPSGADRPVGFLVAGVSSRLPLNDQYQAFVELLANSVTAGIVNARAYEEERKRAEALAELDRAKTAFFTNVSHEFRTPLALILGSVEDIRADLHADAPAAEQERVAVAHRNALRLLKLVNSLLDFSRIEAGRIDASFEPTDLARMTAELASQFESACDKARLELVLDCQPLGQDVHVDRDMWEKIVLNLLSNAFKFTLAGSIRVTVRTEGDRAILTVSDTGTGIPAPEMPKLFERFHRVEGAGGRSFEGTGIGLALVQELVKLHGGTIRAESTLGAGSAFHVALPLGHAHLPVERLRAKRTLASTSTRAEAFVEEAERWLPDADVTPAPPERPTELPALVEGLGRDGRPPRVLVADDNADMRNYIRRILASVRCDVEAVSDGMAALEAARRPEPPDLVLSDVMMPRLDGFGLVRSLRADPRTEGIPVILLSARAGEEARVEGLNVGADDYLIKPFSGRELVARVEGSLRLARARREAAQAERLFLEQALDMTRDRLALALKSAQMGMYDWDLVTDSLTWSPTCKALFGKPVDAAISYSIFLETLHPDDRERVDHAARQSLDPGEKVPFDTEYRVVWPDGSVHWIMARGKVYFENDAPARFTGTVAEVSVQKEIETRLRVLVDELSHRVKNTLAVVQSITEQTFKTGNELPGVRLALIGRLRALAETHTLLTRANWESVNIAKLLERATNHLAVAEAGRFIANGPDVKLTPKAALAMGLVLHELSTNAVKHGAWASEQGSASVHWRVTDGTLEVEWKEAVTGSLAPPTRTGFGSRLIRQAVRYDLGGEVTNDFRPDGLHCVMRVPSARTVVPC